VRFGLAEATAISLSELRCQSVSFLAGKHEEAVIKMGAFFITFHLVRQSE
jgi:hypothetical protein